MSTLRYEAGTLLLEGTPPKDLCPPFVYDPRVDQWRAPAHRYAEIAPALRGKLEANRAPRYKKLDLSYQPPHTPYPHQLEALQHWKDHKGQGLVVLPTGSGKTTLGLLAMSWAGRSTLIVVPTRVLMHQWYAELRAAFPDLPIGLIGDGEYEPIDIAVATYDSAAIHAEKLGNLYGTLIFDEVHHLPTDFYSPAASYSLAPYRLGLTASLDRDEPRLARLNTLVGPLLYERKSQELQGQVLAPYRLEVLKVELSPTEREAYKQALQVRNDFLHSVGLKLGSLEQWSKFIQLSARSEQGRQAMKAHRQAARIATAAPAKLRLLEVILARHAGQKTLLFTKENDLAYQVSQTLLIPCITHQTHVKERQEILEKFASGEYLAIVSGNVMNEGLNIPDAAIAVNLSGSAVERELVQRLGRILRRSGDKEAVFYEVVTADTREERISERRRGLEPSRTQEGQPSNESPQKPPRTKPAQEILLPPVSWDELGKD